MYLLIKPASGACNLRCRYCFYADEMSCREVAVRPMMKLCDMEHIIKKALSEIERHGRGEPLMLGFQGGEPMLAGLDFFRGTVDAVRRENTRGASVSFFLQTNGTLIDGEWADFFAREGFLVGLSLDGTKEIHDKNRIDASGRGSYTFVMRAASLLKRAGAEFNILTVLTASAARHAGQIYDFYKKNGFGWQQYIACIDPIDGEQTGHALTESGYGDFLCRMFDLWYADIKRGEYTYNREFENWIGILLGRPPESCGMVGVCSEQYLIESDGRVYPCDFYALDELCLGNILTDEFSALDARRDELGFIERSRALPEECRACRWYVLCRGGCRRNRETPEGLGKNKFCGAYLKFFHYAYSRMCEIAEMIRRGYRV